MSDNLSDIVKLSIDITSPAAGSAGFDSVLIVGPPPAANPDGTFLAAAAYADLDEVAGAGFVVAGAGADPVGAAARVAFSQNPRPPRIYVAVQRIGGGDGIEPPVETLSRAGEAPGWYVICPAGIGEGEYEEIAEWTEAREKMFAYAFLSGTDPVSGAYYRSHGWCGLVRDGDLPSDVPAANAYLHVALAVKCLSYPAGAETWAFKQLAAVSPSSLSGALKKALTDGNSNYFARYAGRGVSMNGRVRAGEWIDVIRGRDWLRNDMQLRLFNMQIANAKTPFTNSGIIMAENEMIASLKAAQALGIVAEDDYDADGSLVPGFATFVPNAMDVPAEEKASRALRGCTFTARLAGAVHVAEISGSLTY